MRGAAWILAAVALMLGAALLCRLTTEKSPVEGIALWSLATVFALGYLFGEHGHYELRELELN